MGCQGVEIVKNKRGDEHSTAALGPQQQLVVALVEVKMLQRCLEGLVSLGHSVRQAALDRRMGVFTDCMTLRDTLPTIKRCSPFLLWVVMAMRSTSLWRA